jgi:hypothetical protein
MSVDDDPYEVAIMAVGAILVYLAIIGLVALIWR